MTNCVFILRFSNRVCTIHCMYILHCTTFHTIQSLNVTLFDHIMLKVSYLLLKVFTTTPSHNEKFGTGTSCKETFRKKNFKLDSWSPGEAFFPIGTINWLSLKRRRDSDFKQEKREINTSENFPCEFFLARYPCAEKFVPFFSVNLIIFCESWKPEPKRWIYLKI